MTPDSRNGYLFVDNVEWAEKIPVKLSKAM